MAAKGAIYDILTRAAEAIEREVRRQTHADVIGALERGFGPRLGAKRAPEPSRRKGPIQLCPAPRCRERAAPVFGMLCGQHKDTPAATVAKWREARRARKARA